MDTITHGLLGAATALLPLPRGLQDGTPEPSATRAAIVVGVLAAELPDLDYLAPADNAVVQTLRAHRGLSHALVAVPLVALAAALLTRIVFRRARFATLYTRALFAVPAAHLLPDLWTGWGTRLLLPFSERRFSLDWTMVVDLFFTLPLLAAALVALIRRGSFRRAFTWGLSIAAVYLLARIAVGRVLTQEVRREYPGAETVSVFPALLGVTTFRYVAIVDGEYRIGAVSLGDGVKEQARSKPFPTGPLAPTLEATPALREILGWAHFPVVRVEPEGDAAYRVEVADLRYHLGGQPTLRFVVSMTRRGEVIAARLERGGSARELFQRYRGD